MDISKRKIHIEILRIIAIIMVCFNHTSSSGFQAYVMSDSVIKYLLYFIISIISKAGVPLFFMISGALLLGKEEDLATLYKKRVLRIAIVLLVVSLFTYFQFMCGWDISRFSISSFVKMFITASITTPLWYLYSYICMLICLPFLRMLAKAMSDKEYKYLFCVALGLQIFEMIFQVENVEAFNIVMINQIVFFPLFGYYIENKLDFEKVNTSFVLKGIAVLFAFALANGLLNYFRVAPSEDPNIQFYLYKGMYTTAIPVYILIKYLCEKHELKETLKKIIIELGSCCFGVYLIENNLREFIYYPLDAILAPIVTVIPAAFICILVELIVGFPIIWLLKRIKFIDKLI